MICHDVSWPITSDHRPVQQETNGHETEHEIEHGRFAWQVLVAQHPKNKGENEGIRNTWVVEGKTDLIWSSNPVVWQAV